MDIKERLAKIRFFKVIPDLSALNIYEWLALRYCISAARITTDIYLNQVSHRNLEIYKSLRARSDKEGIDLLKYFNIQGSPWDEYDDNRPFVPGAGERPKFGSFYPMDMTKEEYNNWINAHPEDRGAFESNRTVIKRRYNELVAIPYSEEYADQLVDVSYSLRRAASLLPKGTLSKFLNLRADAFSSNNYFDSDMAWVDTDGNPFEVTIGPYETYFDGLLGFKTSFESFIALPDKDATATLQKFTPYVSEFDSILIDEFDFSPKGKAISLEVVTDVIRGGEAAFGNMFVAYNLPNDRRVHDIKGSKKVFSRTMMEAKFSHLASPIAERLLPPGIAEKCSFNNRLLFVLGHEFAHGLGPSKIKVDGREIPFEVALKDLNSALEEAKADMLGVRLLNYFRNCGLIDDESFFGGITTDIIASFQGWRHGFTEAHSVGRLIEYNWLKAAGALRYDSVTKKYEIDPERCIVAMSRLSTQFLNLQIAGDYDRAETFVKHWSTVPAELPEIIEGLADIPTAVSPIYELPA